MFIEQAVTDTRKTRLPSKNAKLEEHQPWPEHCSEQIKHL